MGWQSGGSSALFSRRWEANRCGGLIVASSLCSFTVNGLRTPPPSLGHTKAVPG